jgi:Rrf2 family protein
MAANSRLSVSIHIMTALAYKGSEGSTSQWLAKSVCTNPVVVRRLLSQLRQAGLIVCQSGKSGGCHLARGPEQITLYDIYKTIEEGGPFVIPDKPENKECRVSCNMKQILQDLFDQTQKAIEQSLKRTTLADLLKSVQVTAAA